MGTAPPPRPLDLEHRSIELEHGDGEMDGREGKGLAWSSREVPLSLPLLSGGDGIKVRVRVWFRGFVYGHRRRVKGRR